MPERLNNYKRTRGPRLRRFTSWAVLTGPGTLQTLQTVKCQLLVKSYLFDSKMPLSIKRTLVLMTNYQVQKGNVII